MTAPAPTASSVLRLAGAALVCVLVGLAAKTGDPAVALAWRPALDPVPVAPGPLPSGVDATVAARLTADDVTRGLVGLAALPADDALALRPDQVHAIGEALRRARQARDRARDIDAALPAARTRARAAWAPLVALPGQDLRPPAQASRGAP